MFSMLKLYIQLYKDLQNSAANASHLQGLYLYTYIGTKQLVFDERYRSNGFMCVIYCNFTCIWKKVLEKIQHTEYQQPVRCALLSRNTDVRIYMYVNMQHKMQIATCIHVQHVFKGQGLLLLYIVVVQSYMYNIKYSLMYCAMLLLF